ncbi:acylphosphatase [bacterium (Candidatus Blackallbacteria) CG17_big_fil_post_rev_8_21_14_2_50_48_46]|uniref:Acylphosphatase n=1 Tax=bacterium (Candidatus Blackallbacteria) CG17_big_fil_post_rev_8_21_14_2_50_48_46 TaxID=2014261 RepID=A0A2M7G9Y3_9BACT|nr:MAG: acylphosphatase [bacterium (Candidatus Blackallbacteria) CG18_big_fil_WC_8_21_14_2_50_49_26]PIW18950.1 MAG: acylphosphatase [bacterium (Candidatus Blackallbacteria) CG17_big_fil_post_rev_8_21_14_2_50_48_46]PIW44682.1 MAG: acylphosphatase [bacterium (Candidatus Blackallbacteria) CG13_big_fil_rev_8_21_14_2_50_49_14]
MSLICRHLWIQGWVQGVWFRHNTHVQAQALGELAGWVRNLPDGRVEVKVQGLPEKVEALVAWCHQGPPLARVEKLEQIEEPLDPHLSAFHVRA